MNPQSYTHAIPLIHTLSCPSGNVSLVRPFQIPVEVPILNFSPLNNPVPVLAQHILVSIFLANHALFTYVLDTYSLFACVNGLPSPLANHALTQT